MPKLTRLLVSVRNVFEAEICRRLGVDWIDLKEPSAGSLGSPTMRAALTVSAYLEDFPQRSVALGELTDLQNPTNLSSARELSQLFPVCKVGLSQLGETNNWRHELDNLMEQLQGDLVPVVYADWRQCGAPPPDAILEWACSNSRRFILIDTFLKNGQGLLSHLSSSFLDQFISQANDACVGVVLAGSLKLDDMPHIQALPAAAFAIRGAVCQQGRDSSLDESLVRQWVNAGPWAPSFG